MSSVYRFPNFLRSKGEKSNDTKWNTMYEIYNDFEGLFGLPYSLAFSNGKIDGSAASLKANSDRVI